MARELNKKKIKTICVIAILIAIAVGIFFLVINKDTIFNAIVNKSTIYTQEQLDEEKGKAYNQGFNDAHTNNIELNRQVEQYLNTITAKNNELAEKQTTIDQNNITIAENKAEIKRLENELINTNQNNTQAIQELQNQISFLQLQNQTLLDDNATNLASIVELNNEITNLQEQITTLSNQIAENEAKIAEYEKLKAENEAHKNTINYYEQFIEALETDTQAVALFEANDTVYNAQIVAKGSYANISNPANTDTMTFIGWYVDDILVENINTYPINTNTKFVAKFEISYNVKFMLDNENEFTTIKVVKNGFATELENLPTKAGYELDGFTLNGVDIVDYTEYPITQNTTFIAKFTKVHTITYFADNQIVKTQQVRNGEYIGSTEDITTLLAKDGYDFDGLSINGTEAIDYENYPILANTSFIILYTELHTVTYMSNNEEVTTVVVRHGENAQVIDIENVLFWTVDDEEITIEEYVITKDTIIVANYEYSPYGNWEIVITAGVRNKLNLSYSAEGLDYVISTPYMNNTGVYTERKPTTASSITVESVNKINLNLTFASGITATSIYLSGYLEFDTKTNLWSFTNNGSGTIALVQKVEVEAKLVSQQKLKKNTSVETESLLKLNDFVVLQEKYKMVA